MKSQIPSCCQSRNRRQQVTPEPQPIDLCGGLTKRNSLEGPPVCAWQALVWSCFARIRPRWRQGKHLTMRPMRPARKWQSDQPVLLPTLKRDPGGKSKGISNVDAYVRAQWKKARSEDPPCPPLSHGSRKTQPQLSPNGTPIPFERFAAQSSLFVCLKS